jgi:hypothetical protein
MDAHEIPNIPELLDAETAKRIKSWPQNSNRASSAGHPCVRFLVLSRTANHLRSLHDVGLQRIFDEGNLHEDALMREMQDAGIRTVEQQRAYEWKKFQLTGRIDAKIPVNGSFVPLEVKSCSPNVFPAIRELAPIDMLASRYPWIRKYPAQILLYMLMEGSEYGVMIFKNKTTGEKLQKVFRLEGAMLEYAESILQKLEAVNAHVAADTCPDAALIDDCKGCAFCKTACFPGADYGPGIDILQDPELETKLNRRAELEPASREFDALDKEIKDGFKGKPGSVVGDWIIESNPYETTTYEIPKDIKAGYAIKKQAFRTSIERLGAA